MTDAPGQVSLAELQNIIKADRQRAIVAGSRSGKAINGVVIEGDEELRERIAEIIDGFTDLRVVGAGAAKLIADRAYQQAPENEGALRADIRTFATKRNAGVRVGRKRLPYVGPIIGGHGAPGATRPQGGYVLPNPFIFDAADQRARAVIDNYVEFIDDLTAGRRPKAAPRYRLHEDE